MNFHFTPDKASRIWEYIVRVWMSFLLALENIFMPTLAFKQKYKGTVKNVHGWSSLLFQENNNYLYIEYRKLRTIKISKWSYMYIYVCECAHTHTHTHTHIHIYIYLSSSIGSPWDHFFWPVLISNNVAWKFTQHQKATLTYIISTPDTRDIIQ